MFYMEAYIVCKYILIGYWYIRSGCASILPNKRVSERFVCAVVQKCYQIKDFFYIYIINMYTITCKQTQFHKQY